MVALRTNVLGDGDPFHCNDFGENRVMVMAGDERCCRKGGGSMRPQAELKRSWHAKPAWGFPWSVIKEICCVLSPDLANATKPSQLKMSKSLA